MFLLTQLFDIVIITTIGTAYTMEVVLTCEYKLLLKFSTGVGTDWYKLYGRKLGPGSVHEVSMEDWLHASGQKLELGVVTTPQQGFHDLTSLIVIPFLNPD